MLSDPLSITSPNIMHQNCARRAGDFSVGLSVASKFRQAFYRVHTRRKARHCTFDVIFIAILPAVHHLCVTISTTALELLEIRQNKPSVDFEDSWKLKFTLKTRQELYWIILFSTQIFAPQTSSTRSTIVSRIAPVPFTTQTSYRVEDSLLSEILLRNNAHSCSFLSKYSHNERHYSKPSGNICRAFMYSQITFSWSTQAQHGSNGWGWCFTRKDK